MPLSTNEAAQTLRDIARTERRSANAYGYRASSPHLILWGLIWAAGYSLSYARPQWGFVWPVLVSGGSIAGFWIGWRMRPVSKTGFDWRFAATFAAIVLFVIALFAVLPPHTDIQAGAFFPLLISLFYAISGIWMKANRLLALSVAIAALTLFGFFELPAQFELWMAVVGGGGLILGGIWLRSV